MRGSIGTPTQIERLTKRDMICRKYKRKKQIQILKDRMRAEQERLKSHRISTEVILVKR